MFHLQNPHRAKEQWRGTSFRKYTQQGQRQLHLQSHGGQHGGSDQLQAQSFKYVFVNCRANWGHERSAVPRLTPDLPRPVTLPPITYSGVCYNERCYNERMLQRTIFINKIRMLQRTQMLQRTRRNTFDRRSTRVRMTFRAFPLWLERLSSSLLSFVRSIYQFSSVICLLAPLAVKIFFLIILLHKHSSKRWTNAPQLMNFPQDSHPRWVGTITPLFPPLCDFLCFSVGKVCLYFHWERLFMLFLCVRFLCFCYGKFHYSFHWGKTLYAFVVRKIFMLLLWKVPL